TPTHAALDPLVWPVVTKVPPEARTFAGHSNTVPDIVGRFGTPASLVIFTEGNHLMVVHGEDVLGAFPTWAKSQSQYADLSLGNVILVTLPQPIVVQTIRTQAIALGNLALDFNRESGYSPDIVMGGPAPLQALHNLGVVEPQVRAFAKNRGRALVVRKGNPLGITSLEDVARTGARLAQADAVEAAARAGNIAAVEALVGKSVADARFRPRAGTISWAARNNSSRCPRGSRTRLRGRWTNAIPPDFLLGANVPEPLRAGPHHGSGALFVE